jgi:hypothetical protein
MKLCGREWYSPFFYGILLDYLEVHWSSFKGKLSIALGCWTSKYMACSHISEAAVYCQNSFQFLALMNRGSHGKDKIIHTKITYGVKGVWTSDFKRMKTVKVNTCSVTHGLRYKCCILSKHNKLNCSYFKMYITSGKEEYKVYRLFPAIEQLQIG